MPSCFLHRRKLGDSSAVSCDRNLAMPAVSFPLLFLPSDPPPLFGLAIRSEPPNYASYLITTCRRRVSLARQRAGGAFEHSSIRRSVGGAASLPLQPQVAVLRDCGSLQICRTTCHHCMRAARPQQVQLAPALAFKFPPGGAPLSPVV